MITFCHFVKITLVFYLYIKFSLVHFILYFNFILM